MRNILGKRLRFLETPTSRSTAFVADIGLIVGAEIQLRALVRVGLLSGAARHT